jgi:hypothetical protein
MENFHNNSAIVGNKHSLVMNRALREFYDNRLISLNMPHEWPPSVTSFCGHTLKIQFSVHLWLVWMIFGKG